MICTRMKASQVREENDLYIYIKEFPQIKTIGPLMCQNNKVFFVDVDEIAIILETHKIMKTSEKQA